MTAHGIHKSKAPGTKIPAVQRTAEQEVVAPEAERTEPNVKAQLAGPPSPQQARIMQRMQRTVGNAQVQRMLNGAAVQRQAVPKPLIQKPAAIAQAQRTAETAAPTQEVQRTPATTARPVAPSTSATTTFISRSFLSWGFEKALKMAGVDAKQVMGFIGQAGNAVGSIIKNPAGFARTLVNGVGQGFNLFQRNINRHLQSGLSNLLFGGSGAEIPKDFSGPSLLKLVLQVLGIFDKLKPSVAQQVGKGNVEQAWSEISSPAKMWAMLGQGVGDLKTEVVDNTKNWLITSLVQGAITRIVRMFIPGAGIVTAIQTIYKVIKFLSEQARQIRALLGAVAGSVGAMARGDTSAVAKKIEQVLSGGLSVAMGFFATLAGVGNIAGKVRGTIQKLGSRIQSAVNKMITRVVSKFKGSAGKPGTGAGAAQTNRTNDQQRLRQGVMAGVAAVNKLSGKQIAQAAINPILGPIKTNHKLGVLEPVVQNGYWAVHGEIRRMTERTSKDVADNTSSASTPLHVQLNKSRHSLKGISKSNTPIKPNNTIIIDYENTDLGKVYAAARQAYASKGKKGNGTFACEGITWMYDYVSRSPTDGYLHLTPTHSPPKAINLSRQEAKAVQNYQAMRSKNKNHEEAMEMSRDLAKKLPDTYELSQNALLIIESLK